MSAIDEIHEMIDRGATRYEETWKKTMAWIGSKPYVFADKADDTGQHVVTYRRRSDPPTEVAQGFPEFARDTLTALNRITHELVARNPRQQAPTGPVQFPICTDRQAFESHPTVALLGNDALRVVRRRQPFEQAALNILGGRPAVDPKTHQFVLLPALAEQQAADVTVLVTLGNDWARVRTGLDAVSLNRQWLRNGTHVAGDELELGRYTLAGGGPDTSSEVVGQFRYEASLRELDLMPVGVWAMYTAEEVGRFIRDAEPLLT